MSPRTRTGRFLRGLVLGYVNQVLMTLVGLWLTAFLLAKLGQADYGLWLVATQVLGYLLLLDLGIVALVPREVAFATGRAGNAESAEDLGLIVGRTLRLVFWQLPLVATVALVVWLLLPEAWAPLKEPLAIVMVAFVITFPFRILHSVLSGLQELAFVGVVQTAGWAAGTATTVALVLAGFGLYALAVGWVMNQALSTVLWWWRVRSRYPQAWPKGLPAFRGAALRDRLARSGWVSLSQVARVLLFGTELLIIGRVLGAEMVVPYFCTAKVLTVLGHQVSMLPQTAGSGLAELRVAGRKEDLVRACGALTQTTLMLSGLIVAVVLVVNEGFVVWWVGTEQFGGTLLTMILLGTMLLRHWNLTATYTLFAFARDRRIALTSLADGVFTVAVTVFLVSRLGLLGAALGTLSGVVLVSLPANLAGMARDLRAGLVAQLAGYWPWAWRFAIVAAGAYTLSQRWSPATLPMLVLGTLAAGSAYCVVMLPIALRDPVGIYVRPRLERLRAMLHARRRTTP